VRIRPGELAEIKAGTIDLGFRRWDRPRVVVGTRMRTPVGLIEVTAVEPVDESTITEDDARRAGAASLDALRRGLAANPDRPVFRVGLRWAGEDPRIGLRQQPPTPQELAEIRARLARLDAASAIGPWTGPTLAIIDRSPTVRAPELAANSLSFWTSRAARATSMPRPISARASEALKPCPAPTISALRYCDSVAVMVMAMMQIDE